MSMPDTPEPKPVYRQIASVEESRAAIDEVIGSAQRLVCVFDYDLDHRGFGDPLRIEKLRRFLLRGRAHRLLIALHEPERIERQEARLMALLRQFPAAISINRTLGQARNATDPFVLADDHSVWHQLHYTQLRAVVALHSPPDAVPLRGKFDEIWELSEPAISSSTTGL